MRAGGTAPPRPRRRLNSSFWAPFSGFVVSAACFQGGFGESFELTLGRKTLEAEGDK